MCKLLLTTKYSFKTLFLNGLIAIYEAVALMWHKAVWIEHPMWIELTHEGAPYIGK